MQDNIQIIKDFILGNDVVIKQRKNRFNLAYEVYRSIPQIIDGLKKPFVDRLFNEIQSLPAWSTEDWKFEQEYQGCFKWYKEKWMIGDDDAVYYFYIEPSAQGTTYGICRFNNRFKMPAEEKIFSALSKKGFAGQTTWWVAYFWQSSAFSAPEFLVNLIEESSPDYEQQLQVVLAPVKQLSISVEKDELVTFISEAVDEYKVSKEN